MPAVYRDDGSVSWNTLALLLIAVLAVLLVGYAASYPPADVDLKMTTVVPTTPGPAEPPGPAAGVRRVWRDVGIGGFGERRSR
jgi:hypothetical protein